jgi:hypothetical protein
MKKIYYYVFNECVGNFLYDLRVMYDKYIHNKLLRNIHD